MKKGKFFINGEWQDGKHYFTSVNPNTSDDFGHVPIGLFYDVDIAVKSAREALPLWRETSISERASILQKVVDLLILEYGEEGSETPLKKLISEEMGKRLPEADIEVIESSDMLSYFVNNSEQYLSPREVKLNSELWPSKHSELIFEPKGVVAVIKAWNYPLEVPIWSIAPALMSGNTVVFKPSEFSSFVAIELVKLFEKAGIPKGVLNLVTGDKTTGELLVDHEGIDMVSFTGGIKAGTEINVKCAKRHIKCCLELSGNDAAIVTSEADLELTSNGLVWGAFCNSGQVCVGVKRAYIHESIYDELMALIINKAKSLVPKKDYGPMVSSQQVKFVESYIDDVKNKGGKILSGGKTHDDFKGNYFSPTILSNLNEKMLLLTEECFGPLLPVIKVKSTEEAIRLANKSNYGLGASVWSKNLPEATLIAKKLRTGMVWINDVNVAFPEAPWGGVKNSGGGKDLSEFGIYEYVNIKHINTEKSRETKRDWWYPY